MPLMLIVEDDENMAYGLKINFEQEGYSVVLCHTGEEALQFVRSQDAPAIMILDLMLPGISGLEVLRAVRDEDLSFPVVVLSAKSSELDKVMVLRAGADDYVSKPFSLLELIERVRLRVRSAQTEHTMSPHSAQNARLVIDLDSQTARVDGRPFALAPMELKLLTELVKAEGRALNRKQLLETVWQTRADLDTHTVEVHIARIRSKLKEVGLEGCVATVRKHGFRWACSKSASLLDPG